MAMYEELSKINIVRPIIGVHKMDPDGRIGIPLTMNLQNPWLENGIDHQRKCMLWLQTYFKRFQVLPKGCTECWKTYYFPETLKELMEIYRFQQEDSKTFVNITAKCGIEVRPFTARLGGYGAFWYNPLGCGLAQARKNTYTLSEALGKKLLLKRGCTEMEHYTKRAFGFGSDDWNKVLGPRQRFMEELLDSTFYIKGEVPDRTPEALAVEIKMRWIEHAAEHGDKTYLDFVDEPFFPSIVQYAGSIHNPKDYKGDYDVTDNNRSEQETCDRKACGTESSGIESLEEV